MIKVGFLVLLTSLALPAQEITASIVGTITDPTGSPIPNSKVSVIATDRGITVRTLDTDADGSYNALLLPIGTYTVKAAAPGFKAGQQSGIELHVSDRLTVNLQLQIGDVSETVTVEASVATVELQSPATAGLISGEEVRELSLNNRNYIQLISLMPGVTSNAATDEVYIGTTNPTGGTNTIPFSISGGRTSGNNLMVDGADNVDRGSNLTLLAYPSVDAIAEFKALRGQYSAEFGRGSTGQINVITKSGTNKFHGSAYEFFKNDALSANFFFNNARNIKRAPLRWNDFGYTLGGPVPGLGTRQGDRNKTFFFWSQEIRRIITYSTFQALAPTDDLKRGIFASPICLQATGNTCDVTGTEIPASQVSPLAAAYIRDVWSKIPAGDPTTFNLFSSQRNLYNYRQELIKIDHVFTPSHQVSVRYIRDAIPTEEPGGLFTGSALPGVATTKTDSPGRGWMFRATSTITPTVLNEAGYSYSYGAIVSRPIGLAATENSPGIKPNLPFPVTLNRIPTLSVSGASSVTGFGPYDDFNRNHNFFDNVTKIMRKHTLKMGASLNFYQKIENAGGNNVGTFSTTNTPRPTGTPSIYQGWANFLLGNVSSFSQASLDLTPDMRVRQFETYIQDDYRMRPNLTVNIGVRYSNYRQPYDGNGMLSNFDPARWDPAKAPQIAPNGNLVQNTGDPLNGIVVNGGPYGSKVSNEAKGAFAPRIGLAWDPFKSGRTAIRSGYGISYDSTLVGIYEQNIFANPPYVNSVTIPNTRLDHPAQGTASVSLAPKIIRGTPLPAMLPYTQQWSFDIQHQLMKNTVASVGYYGSKSTHLLGIVEMNMVPPGLAVATGLQSPTAAITSVNTPALNQIRPFRGYSAINAVENWFNSNYNSLQVSAQKYFTGGFSLRFSYTYSKVLTDSTSDRSNAPQNFYNRSAEYARASFDRTHVSTISYIYRIPAGRSLKGPAGFLLKGWQVSGIVALYAGLPLRVTSGLGLDWGGLGIIPGAATPRPDRISDPNADAPHTILQWFNTNAFAPVPAGEVRPGNAAATTVAGPGMVRLDSSLFKNVRLVEKVNLVFRFETFNTLNHTNYAGVSTSLGTTNFGQITSTREPRRIQLAVKIVF